MWYICAPLEADIVSLMTMKVVLSTLFHHGQPASHPTGNTFPIGSVFSVFYSGEYHATKYTPDHGAHCARV
ncbi:hypothetical protein [Xenorhabdus cabanillasii]|uniref:hypothetical protein n=1 Tax=Xenorhabdus cabanillasii TaxID=351673 RepID=UPI001474BD9A|nr:hypothetical protein [Xenorhabdus cabanillasii]